MLYNICENPAAAGDPYLSAFRVNDAFGAHASRGNQSCGQGMLRVRTAGQCGSWSGWTGATSKARCSCLPRLTAASASGPPARHAPALCGYLPLILCTRPVSDAVTIPMKSRGPCLHCTCPPGHAIGHRQGPHAPNDTSVSNFFFKHACMTLYQCPDSVHNTTQCGPHIRKLCW